MERPAGMKLHLRPAVGIIILFHLVGLIGLSLPATCPLFLQIVPWHLLLMLLVVVIGHYNVNSRYGLFVLIIFITGFLAEWIGVHTGWLFGSYAYGSTLGSKVFGIPLMIGVNWFLLIYAAGVTMQLSRIKSLHARVAVGAAILVLLDILIEPVAIRLDYWHWLSSGIPLKNYVCWFLVSALMLYIFEWFRFKKQSITAPVLLLTEFIFFGLLNLFI